METKHADQLAAKRAGESAPQVHFDAPDGRPEAYWFDRPEEELQEEDEDLEDLPSNFERILHLLRPLTSLETRIKTTLELHEGDGDSPIEEHHPQQELPSVDTSNNNEPPKEGAATSRIEPYPDEPTVLREEKVKTFDSTESIWHPFRNGYEFKLARWMMDANLSKVQIDAFFNNGLARVPPATDEAGKEGTCFTSAYTLGQLLDEVDPHLNMDSWTRAAVDHYGTGLIEFRYRSLENMIRHIFAQQSHEDYMVYMPYKEFDSATGYRIYSEAASAQWWWDIQVHSTPQLLYIPLTLHRRIYRRVTSLFHCVLGQTRPFRRTLAVTRTFGPLTSPFSIFLPSTGISRPSQPGDCSLYSLFDRNEQIRANLIPMKRSCQQLNPFRVL